MEPEPAKATDVEHENKTKPDPTINNNNNNNKDDDIINNTPPRLSSSSSASSSLSLEFTARDENGPDPWSMMSEPEPSSGDYDPSRIPSSIFSSNKAEGWSLASNESLFSIHMANNCSFSRDHAILCEKSDELGRLDDWTNEHELMVSTGGIGQLATVSEETSGGGVSRVESFSSKGPQQQQQLATSKSLNSPRLSNESGNSCASFAFPVLVGDGVKRAGSSRKSVMTAEQRRGSSEEEVCETPPPTQQGPGEQGGPYWYSRLCCCCCCWTRCC